MKKYYKALVFIFVIAIGFLLNRELEWGTYFTNPKNFKNLLSYVENNYLFSVFLYLIFTVIGSSVLALPGATFAVIAAGIFGFWAGSFYCLIGATVGAVFSFLLSRYLLRDSIKGLIQRNERLDDLIFHKGSEQEMLILMITRLLPIFPFNLQNFAYGITDISLTKYTMGTFIFMAPGVIFFSMATEGVINSAVRGQMLLAALVILVLMVIIGMYLYKKYKILEVREQHEG